jgi:peroxiredoxin
MNRRISRIAALLVAVTLATAGAAADDSTAPPKVGEKARALTLDTLDGKTVSLSELRKTGPVVLIELRGWVGYQCPLCTRQVGEFIARADDLRKAGATVVLVYPGPPDRLREHAADFIGGKGLPENFRFVTDPGLTFVKEWGLRWDQAGETAYPATFVVASNGTVRFAKLSHSHGDRATAKEVLAAVPAKP